MNNYSEKEQMLIGRMCDHKQVEKLEKRRRWLLWIIITAASVSIVMTIVTICFRGCLPDGRCIIAGGLSLGIIGLSIELIDHRILLAKVLRQQVREAAADAMYDLRKLNIRPTDE